MQKTAVFLFAHQDDEFGVYGEIDRLIKSNIKIIAIYLTAGSLDGTKRLNRNHESLKVLNNMGVVEKNIYFLGTDLQVPDAKLCEHLNQLYPKILNLLQSIGNLSPLYILAYEGGHQDHDAAHIIGLAIAKTLNILDHTFLHRIQITVDTI